ncbi:MAG: hypothetical protein IAG13_04280 [Deltaproteobacteria bacterium]|nr:hypothetical protein [Nannocystaceae bacterium]
MPTRKPVLVVLGVLWGCGRTELHGFGPRDGDGSDLPGAPVDCDKVDFLFVIDNSGSMGNYQEHLVGNFGVFTEGVERVVEGNTDLHVGVTTSEVYAGTKGECHQLGGLIDDTSPSGRACGPFSGGHYMTNEDDIESGFECAAKVGTQGGEIERPMDALVAAIDGSGDAAQCNAGFLRPDALLVAVVVTDEWDGPGDPEGEGSWTTPDLWSLGLLSTKGSDQGYVLVGLLNEERGQCGSNRAEDDGHVLAEFIESQPFGFVGSICSDYSETFANAVDVVAAACAGE